MGKEGFVKERLFLITFGILIVIVGAFAVIAQVNTGLPWHNASQVGLSDGKSLQEAIDSGSIGGERRAVLDNPNDWTEEFTGTFSVGAGTYENETEVPLDSSRPVFGVRIRGPLQAHGGYCSPWVKDYFSVFSGAGVSGPTPNYLTGFTTGMFHIKYGTGSGVLAQNTIAWRFYEKTGGTVATEGGTGTSYNPIFGYSLPHNGLEYVPPGKTLRIKRGYNGAGNYVGCNIDILYGRYA